MTRILAIVILCLISGSVRAQKIDSIYFHLYTDSLKKGTHNYINVDGKMANGTWMPLTAKELLFSSSECRFSGNELIVPADFGGEKITVKAVLRSNPALAIERTIWIKKKADGPLPTEEEVLKEFRKKGRKKRNYDS